MEGYQCFEITLTKACTLPPVLVRDATDWVHRLSPRSCPLSFPTPALTHADLYP